MEATVIDDDEKRLTGKAFGEFGPVELDPSAKQTLEKLLGTGGTHFPVTLTIPNSE